MKVTARIAALNKTWGHYVDVVLLVNGSVVTGKGGITIRSSEIVYFLLHIGADKIEVDRENMPEHIVEKLEGYPHVFFI